MYVCLNYLHIYTNCLCITHGIQRCINAHNFTFSSITYTCLQIYTYICTYIHTYIHTYAIAGLGFCGDMLGRISTQQCRVSHTVRRQISGVCLFHTCETTAFLTFPACMFMWTCLSCVCMLLLCFQQHVLYIVCTHVFIPLCCASGHAYFAKTELMYAM